MDILNPNPKPYNFTYGYSYTDKIIPKIPVESF